MPAVFFCTICLVHAQTNPGYKALSNYAQPAPNAASLGKYVDYPVGYYTGTPNISVPLYQLKDGAASLNVSLSYHASGIRVSELSSWVGLGWSLQGAGMIIRTIKGGPDEGVANQQAMPRGYFLDSGIRKMPMLPYPVNGVFVTNTAAQQRASFLEQAAAGNVDCEPDLFTFNFNGFSGKFVFDENRTPRVLSEQDIKISVNYSGGNFQSWLIVTPDGTKYYFGENSMNEVTRVYSNEVSDDNTMRPSNWQLTRIVYPNSKDTVYFEYTPEVYGYFDLGSETFVYDQVNGANSSPQACSAYPGGPPSKVLRTSVSGLRLTSIRTKNYQVSFIAKTQRQDVVSYAGNPYPYRLDSVKIFNKENQCIRQYLLSYSYFTSTTATDAWVGILALMNNDVSDTKRLKLLSVKEFSGDASLAKPAHVFTYNEAYQLPRRISYDQDHWGYSNNYNGDANDRFTPRVEHPLCKFFTGIFANRNPSWPSMQSYSIKSVKDPLGVTTEFEFEPHYSYMQRPYHMVGGLRVKKITVTDSVTGRASTRRFDYGAGGVLYRIPQYLLEPHNEYYFLLYPEYPSYVGYTFAELNVIRSLYKQSQSVVPLQDFNGNHIGYPTVTEIYGANGEGGYKVYGYMADEYRSTSRLSLYNFAENQSVQGTPNSYYGPNTGIYGNGHFNDIAPENLQYYDGFMANMFYPFAPQQPDLRRGQLINVSTYDSAGNIIRSEHNEYRQQHNETYWMRGFKLYRTATRIDNGNPQADILYNDALTYYKLHTGISRAVGKTVIEYKDGKSTSTSSRYGYESDYHTLKTADTTVNSQGDSIITKNYYAFDYANSAGSVIAKMKARNMLLPVAQRVWKNNRLIGGAITQYSDFAANSPDTFINPLKLYSLETTTALNTAQAGESIKLNGQFSALIPNSYFKEKASYGYDGETGRIKEQKLISDKTQVLIWDNQAGLPMAVVENGYSSQDVAYSSFESGETGNWTLNSAAIVTDATAPTGNKAYAIASGLTKTGLTSTRKYTVSFWYKTGTTVNISGGTISSIITGRMLNGWTYKHLTITDATSLSFTGTSGYVDEFRLYPADGQMTSFTYDNYLRLAAQCAPNSTISRFEYDALHRLLDVKDQDGNIIKVFEYNYGRLSRPGQ